MIKEKKRNRAVVLFAKAPLEGRCKTRLIPELGVKKATEIYKKLLKETVRNMLKLKDKDIIVFYSPRGYRKFFEWISDMVFLQRGEDLGERMFNAFQRVFAWGYETAVLIGSDIPGLDDGVIKDAFTKLGHSDVVFGPSTDGGYYLIGLKRPWEGLFVDIPWSSKDTLRESLKKAEAMGLKVSFTRELSDLDTVEDYRYLKTKGML